MHIDVRKVSADLCGACEWQTRASCDVLPVFLRAGLARPLMASAGVTDVWGWPGCVSVPAAGVTGSSTSVASTKSICVDSWAVK